MPTPLEVYNKRIKKREKEKRKRARIEVRESKKLLEDPEKLKKELDELTHKAIIGRIDAESLERKEKIEKLWDEYTKAKKTKEKESGSETEGSGSKEESSSESDYSDSDDGPKCVIEIQGQEKKQPPEKEGSKRKRGFHDPDPPDDFALELMSHVPKLEEPKVQEKKVVGGLNRPEGGERKGPKPFKLNYTPRPHPNMVPANVPYTLNPPPPPMMPFPMMPNLQHFRPQPPPMMMTYLPPGSAQMPPPREDKKEEVAEKPEVKVPLSKYFVPSQVRLNRKNPDKRAM